MKIVLDNIRIYDILIIGKGIRVFDNWISKGLINISIKTNTLNNGKRETCIELTGDKIGEAEARI